MKERKVKELTRLLPGIQTTLCFLHKSLKIELRCFTICHKFVNELQSSTVIISFQTFFGLRQNMCPFFLVFFLLLLCK